MNHESSFSTSSSSPSSTEDLDYDESDGMNTISNYSNDDLIVRNDTVAGPLNNKDIIIKQFVQNVVDFSSQYGTDYSISYTAFNITGKPCKFPDYGDFPETYAMRTYGEWWDKSPSKCVEIMPQNTTNIPIHDFIVVEFEEFVYPLEVRIYETYNPGAIVKIWAFTITEKWIPLWSGFPQKQTNSRIFKPPLKKILHPTKIIRLEFNHSKLDYFTEIDAIMLIGRKFKQNLKSTSTMSNGKNSNCGKWNYSSGGIVNGCGGGKGRILAKLEQEKFEPQITENREDIFKDFIKNGLEKFMEEAGLVPDGSNDSATLFTLKDLPSEILYKIFSYLDLVSLFRIAQVCRKLNDVATDPFLYNEVSLKPYWYCASTELMDTLTKRATHIKKLDLSWCGIFNSIRPVDFKELVMNCGDNITHLRLNSCSFLSNFCIDLIGSKCTNLKELSLRNFKGDSNFLWGLVSLRHLERLDLFRSVTEPEVLFSILKNNPNLQHLNLGFCGLTVDMDQIALYIGKYNKQIISIDMWKSHSLTSIGIQALSECHQLEEVDFGWCLREEAAPGESLKMLLKGCPKLKKIFLAAIRGITDRDLDNIVNFCPHVEQLDLMGIMGISTEMCYKILNKCKHLKLIDLSFCDQLDEIQISLWREIFDASIKRSYIPSDLLF